MQYASGGDLLEQIPNSGPLTEPTGISQKKKYVYYFVLLYEVTLPYNILLPHTVTSLYKITVDLTFEI